MIFTFGNKGFLKNIMLESVGDKEHATKNVHD